MQTHAPAARHHCRARGCSCDHPHTHLILCLTGYGLIIFIDDAIIVRIRVLLPVSLGSEDPEEDTNDNILNVTKLAQSPGVQEAARMIACVLSSLKFLPANAATLPLPFLTPSRHTCTKITPTKKTM